jgi:hypothetical protein
LLVAKSRYQTKEPPMSADIALSTTASKNPFETARRKLIAALLKIKAPASYPAFPTPSDHEAVAAHIREAAAIFDEWLAAIGSEVRDNASSQIDANLFAGSFLGAIDGNETWACQNEALQLSDERRAMRRAS